jgi:phenylpyruvate tautomerase PptA (4-oxalocrotonate tautomerase family)
VPTVMIYQSPRPLELKRRTAAAITDALVDAYGLRPDQIHVYFHESDDESWGKGGLLATDQRAGPPSAA